MEKPSVRRRALGAGFLERETGFEPATSTLARSHSTAELLPLVLSFYCTCAFAANSLHPHWHPLIVLLFRIGHITTVRQETLDELGLGVPCLVAVVHDACRCSRYWEMALTKNHYRVGRRCSWQRKRTSKGAGSGGFRINPERLRPGSFAGGLPVDRTLNTAFRP
jgi:hypothetical protein